MRSLLFVPGDSPRKFDRASAGDADALILDLEDSVAPDGKLAARATVAAMLGAPRGRQALFVRVNALDTGLTLADLAAVMPARPDGIVLPKCAAPTQLVQLGHWLDAFEATTGIAPGRTRLIAIATETASSLFTLGDYAAAGPRLLGMMWGAEDLAASLGASGNRDGAVWRGPFRMARDLCLAGAAAAGVLAIGVHYAAYCSEVYRAGFDNIPRGQWEASTALNLSTWATFRDIIIPQIIPPIVPALGNYLVALFKETPLLSAIAVLELMQTAKIMGSETFRYTEPMTLVGLFFLAMSLVSAALIRATEGAIRRRMIR